MLIPILLYRETQQDKSVSFAKPPFIRPFYEMISHDAVTIKRGVAGQFEGSGVPNNETKLDPMQLELAIFKKGPVWTSTDFSEVHSEQLGNPSA